MNSNIGKSLTLRPRVSEKSYELSEKHNVYIFEVSSTTNKQSVASAVATQFDVTVLNVNTSNLKGKIKRTVRKRNRPMIGRQNDVKKAYVTLKEGDSIAVFKSTDKTEAIPESKKGKK